MVEIINSHASHGIEEGLYVCKAKGCTHVYGEEAYPEAIVVTAHVVNRLNAAGFGSRHDAWAEGYGAGKVVMTELMSPTHFATEKPNPYPVTR
jgi:hypothetical protein